MPAIKANQITIEYETFGKPENPALVLIMGLSMQLLGWPEEFCELLAAQGFHVIRFDNRDIGLSEKLHGMRAPSPLRIMLHRALRTQARVPYTLDDMALDTVGLLDALELPAAHVVGASMGGMIAQLVAAKHGHRVKSLTSIMSTSGRMRYSVPRAQVIRQLIFKRPKSSREEDILAYATTLWALIGSPGYPMPEEMLKERVLRAFRRSHYPQGFLRHLAAILANGDRSQWLGQIQAPTLVIHGTADPLVPVSGGKDTAAKIPGARLALIEGMGHNLPPALLPKLSTLIGEHAQEAERIATTIPLRG